MFEPTSTRQLQQQMIYDALRSKEHPMAHEFAIRTVKEKMRELTSEEAVWKDLEGQYKASMLLCNGLKGMRKQAMTMLLEGEKLGEDLNEVKQIYVYLYGGGLLTQPAEVRLLQQRMIYDMLRWNQQPHKKAESITARKMAELKSEAEVWAFIAAKSSSIGLRLQAFAAYPGRWD